MIWIESSWCQRLFGILMWLQWRIVSPLRIHHKVNFSCDYAPVYSVIQVWPASGEHRVNIMRDRWNFWIILVDLFKMYPRYLFGIVKLWLQSIGWHVEFVIVENVNPGRIHHKVNFFLWLRPEYALVTLSEHLVNIMRNRWTFWIIPVDLFKN